MHFFQWFITAATLFFVIPANACICMNYTSLEENIKMHQFIAHVKIAGKTVRNDTTRTRKHITIKFTNEAKLVLDIIELFKGDSVTSLREYDIQTSCEIGVSVGSEWIIFASYDSVRNEYFIAGCTASQQYRNNYGERSWHWDVAGSLLARLQKQFNHPTPADNHGDGLIKSYYQNGSLEWVATYSNNKLHGNRKIFFADGRLHIDDNFIDGKHHGSYKRYDKKGHLISEATYQHGQCIASKDWEAKIIARPNGKIEADQEGKPWLSRDFYWRDSSYSISTSYYPGGKTEAVSVYDYKGDSCVSTHYYPSGNVNYRTIRHWNKKKEYYWQWDKEGKLEMEHVYIDGVLVESKQ